MPTSKDEAKRIAEIFDEYLERDDVAEIAERLHQEVGKPSDNVSLKVSLQMMDAIYNKKERKKFIKHKIFWECSLFTIIVLHFALLLGNCISFFLLPFLAPWYIAMPVMSFIVTLAFNRSPCPITLLEDYIRWNKLGKPKIKKFIKYYIVDPIRKFNGTYQEEE